MNRDRAPAVIGGGAPIVDLIAGVPETFLRGGGGEKGGMERIGAWCLEDLVGERPIPPAFAPDGCAGNTACALARLGANHRLRDMLGDDGDGAFFRNNLQAADGDTASLRVHPSLPKAGRHYRCLRHRRDGNRMPQPKEDKA